MKRDKDRHERMQKLLDKAHKLSEQIEMAQRYEPEMTDEISDDLDKLNERVNVKRRIIVINSIIGVVTDPYGGRVVKNPYKDTVQEWPPIFDS